MARTASAEDAAEEAQELERHDPDVPAHAHRAEPVVAHGADGARDVRAVTDVVDRVGVVVHEVVAVVVVDVAVEIVVDPVARNLAGVGPHVRRQVGVRVVHAGIDDADDHVARSGGGRPRARSADVGARRAARLPHVVQRPHLGKQGVAREDRRLPDEVGLDVDDVRIGAPARDRFVHAAGAEADALHPRRAERDGVGGAEPRQNRLMPSRRDAVAEPEDHFVGLVGLRRGGGGIGGNDQCGETRRDEHVAQEHEGPLMRDRRGIGTPTTRGSLESTRGRRARRCTGAERPGSEQGASEPMCVPMRLLRNAWVKEFQNREHGRHRRWPPATTTRQRAS